MWNWTQSVNPVTHSNTLVLFLCNSAINRKHRTSAVSPSSFSFLLRMVEFFSIQRIEMLVREDCLENSFYTVIWSTTDPKGSIQWLYLIISKYSSIWTIRSTQTVQFYTTTASAINPTAPKVFFEKLRTNHRKNSHRCGRNCGHFGRSQGHFGRSGFCFVFF